MCIRVSLMFFGFSSPSALLGCVANDWTPQIGDPDVTGWLTVLSYLLCLALALAVLRCRPAGAARGFWRTTAPLMAFLAVNKQLDLQTALTATGRCMAHAQGWYDNRQVVQLAFIAGLLLGVLCALVWAARSLRERMSSNGLALIGLAVLSGFVLVRAVGFHHVDRLISMDFATLKFNFWFENAGLVLIAINALVLLVRGRRNPAPRHHTA
jgi:asparagine N-glycosylation enzyme membrane subunit Stt3